MFLKVYNNFQSKLFTKHHQQLQLANVLYSNDINANLPRLSDLYL